MSKNAQLPTSHSMPDWRELGERLGEQLPSGYATNNPLETLSAFQHAFGRNKLIDAIQRELHIAEAHPGTIHASFCNLPFEVVVTTNIEQLLEQQYRNKYGSVLQVIEQEQLRVANPYRSPMLVKLHGDLHHPSSLVLTESDYDSFLDQRPLFATWLANQLITKTGVLIGYSLDDPDFRAVLAWVRARLGGSPPDLYVVEVNADPVKADRYERRGVRIINIQARHQGWNALGTLFDALAEYWQAQAPSRVTASTTIGRAVLRAQSRIESLVLFIVSRSRLSDYSENVFPALIERGWIPISEEDILSPPGNELAGLDLLIRAANQVVVEIQQPSDPLLLRAIRSVGYDRVITIVPASLAREAEEYDQWQLQGPDIAADWDEFTVLLISQLQLQRQTHVSLDYLGGVVANVRSLLEMKQYQIAFLIGVIELEGRLNRFLAPDLGSRGVGGGRATLRALLNAAQQSEILRVSPEEIKTLTDGRNLVVHGRYVPPQELGDLARLVLRLLEQLPED